MAPKIRALMVLALVISAASAIADEVRIVDPRGLVRLSVEIAEPITLLVEIAPAQGDVVVILESLSGGEQRRATITSGNRAIRFGEVPSGIWQIRSEPAEIMLRSVRREP